MITTRSYLFAAPNPPASVTVVAIDTGTLNISWAPDPTSTQVSRVEMTAKL